MKLALSVDFDAEEEGDEDEIVNHSDKAAFIVRV